MAYMCVHFVRFLAFYTQNNLFIRFGNCMYHLPALTPPRCNHRPYRKYVNRERSRRSFLWKAHSLATASCVGRYFMAFCTYRRAHFTNFTNVRISRLCVRCSYRLNCSDARKRLIELTQNRKKSGSFQLMNYIFLLKNRSESAIFVGSFVSIIEWKRSKNRHNHNIIANGSIRLANGVTFVAVGFIYGWSNAFKRD